MQEVFEKIKERLKELGWVFAEYYPDGTAVNIRTRKSVAYDDVVEIVNQVAEEYSSKSSSSENDGWIPCSERLPEVEADVLLTLRGLTIHTGFRANTEGYFYVDGGEYVEFEDVIAWQTLPAPYKPKGGNNG